MKRRLQRFLQIALMLFVFAMILPNVKAQTIGSQIRIGADSTISYWNGSAWIAVPPGLPGQSLQFTNGIPAWIDFPVTDYDGNAYDVITIGTQRWLKQNLNVTHYRNGDAIPNITDITNWSNLTTGTYCNFYNDTNYAITYGRLYNFYSVVDSRNLCPIGWHVSSDADWTLLTTYLGGENIAGGKLKATNIWHINDGNGHYYISNMATNETGFTALPNPYRDANGQFAEGQITLSGYWWSTTEYNSIYSWCIYMRGNSYSVDKNPYTKQAGLAVRCLKD